jgi:hypothetical protein
VGDDPINPAGFASCFSTSFSCFSASASSGLTVFSCSGDRFFAKPHSWRASRVCNVSCNASTLQKACFEEPRLSICRVRQPWLMSASGTKQTLISTLNMSAFGGKADIADFHSDVR